MVWPCFDHISDLGGMFANSVYQDLDIPDKFLDHY